MARFFLSHSNATPDSDFAKCVAGRLTLLGAQVWYDSMSIRPGDYWRSEIVRGLWAAENFILLLSHNSWKAPWCQAEVMMALSYAAIPQYKRQIFVVRLDEVEITTTRLGQRLSIVQHLDARRLGCGDTARSIEAAEGALHWSDLPYKELVAAYGNDVPRNESIAQGVGSVASHENVLPPPPRQMVQDIQGEALARNYAFH